MHDLRGPKMQRIWLAKAARTRAPPFRSDLTISLLKTMSAPTGSSGRRPRVLITVSAFEHAQMRPLISTPRLLLLLALLLLRHRTMTDRQRT